MLDQMMKMLEGQQIGPYRLNKFLGAGGFGGVFHASEMVRNTSVQEVAIKVIPESSDDKLIELTNARKLEHSNLIKAYSVGEFTFLNKYLSKINYTHLTTSCLLPLAFCLSSLGN
ncbi:hypothetical protein MICAK_2910001 [Microcystis aeruginosa PCC 9701]|uniref:Protein kinase domain-containing protein n=1 Tax=Microcystis aeruginosa PCC 9701 TaxID=721123 RepID=I4IRT8_MICAE|nr:hypothetical protein MICAK_2910001 [Microcystis aeruginosa PCC 9701]